MHTFGMVQRSGDCHCCPFRRPQRFDGLRWRDIVAELGHRAGEVIDEAPLFGPFLAAEGAGPQMRADQPDDGGTMLAVTGIRRETVSNDPAEQRAVTLVLMFSGTYSRASAQERRRQPRGERAACRRGLWRGTSRLAGAIRTRALRGGGCKWSVLTRDDMNERL